MNFLNFFWSYLRKNKIIFLVSEFSNDLILFKAYINMPYKKNRNFNQRKTYPNFKNITRETEKNPIFVYSGRYAGKKLKFACKVFLEKVSLSTTFDFAVEKKREIFFWAFSIILRKFFVAQSKKWLFPRWTSHNFHIW